MNRVSVLLGLMPAGALAGCRESPSPPAGPGTPPALEITGRFPGPDDAGVETGAAIAVTFNEPLDPATLDPFPVTVSDGADQLPLSLAHDPSTRTVTVTAPLLPGRTYEVVVGTGLQTLAGATLPAPQAWTFATRVWQSVLVDSMGTGPASSMALDQSGRLHVSYWDVTNDDLKYAVCAGGCGATVNWRSTAVDTAGSLGQTSSLAVDAGGRVHVAYADFSNGDLRYATCAADCHEAGNWQRVVADSTGNGGWYSSLVIHGGRIHVTHLDYADVSNFVLRYSTCVSACATPAGWESGVVAPGLGAGEGGTALAAGPDGRLHLGYRDAATGDLRYGTCPAGCAAPSSWQTVTVDTLGDVGRQPSLALGSDGRVHVLHHEFTRDLEYATCPASCATADAWRRATLATGGFNGETPSLAVDGGGRLHLSYYDRGGAQLTYATCAAGCADPAQWRTLPLDPTAGRGESSSIVVGPGGRVRVSYRDDSSFDPASAGLRFIE